MTTDASTKQDHCGLLFYFYQTYLLLKSITYPSMEKSS